MNITDLMISGGFLAHEKLEIKGEASKFLDYISNLPPLNDSKPTPDRAARLLESLPESNEKEHFSIFLNQLTSREKGLLFEDPVALEVALSTFMPSVKRHPVSEQSFLDFGALKKPLFEHSPHSEAASSLGIGSNATSFRVTKTFEDPKHVLAARDSLAFTPQQTEQMGAQFSQIPAQVPHPMSVDDRDRIIKKAPLQPTANFANPLVPSFENMQISEIHPRKPWPHTPEIPALTKTTHQVQDRSPLPSINERDSLLKDPIFSDKAQNIAKNISLFRVSETGIIAPTMTRKPVDFSAQPAQTELRLNTAAVVETTPRHPADRQLDQSAGQSNRQPLHSKSILLSESHVEPQFKLSIPSPASERAATDTSQASKNIVSGQFANPALQHSNSNTIFENSFPVTAIEQGDPDITPPLQSDVSKSPLQAVLGSEKSRHPIMQQIVPKLIDQLVFKGDGKIDIMLSPKDLGKVEFSFQSHDKSGLSIVILAERDETAALVRRHMDVLTKEFERLGYSDIDFSCDGQSERQKSKSSPTNERESTDNTNPQQSKAQSGSIPAYGYSLSTAIDIRL